MLCTPRWPGEDANEGAPDDQQRTSWYPHPGQPAIGRRQDVVRVEDRYDTDIHAEHLAAYLAGRERGDSEARWDDLVPPYQDLAANIG